MSKESEKSFFSQLPAAWREGINKAIHDVYGDEHPEIMEAFREWEAASDLGCDLSNPPTPDQVEDLSTGVLAFVGGWTIRGGLDGLRV